MRAGRQNKERYVIIGGLSLVLCSILSVISFSSTSSALLGIRKLDTSSAPLQLESPTVVKKLTSRVPVVSSLLNPPKETPAPTPAPQSSSPEEETSSVVQTTKSKSSSTGSSKEQTEEQSNQTQAAAMPVIKQQASDFTMLQPVSEPFLGPNVKLASATVRPAESSFAVLEPSEEGWRLLSVAWYWWILLAATTLGVILWREKLFVFALMGRDKLGYFLRPKH